MWKSLVYINASSLIIFEITLPL